MGKHDCQMALTTVCIYIQRSYKGRLTFISPISYGAKFHKILGKCFLCKISQDSFFKKIGAKFYNILGNCFNSKKPFALRPLISVRKSPPHSWKLEQNLVTEQWGRFVFCQNQLFGIYFRLWKGGYRCSMLEDIGVKVVVCHRITTLQQQAATGEGEIGWGGGDWEGCKGRGSC